MLLATHITETSNEDVYDQPHWNVRDTMKCGSWLSSTMQVEAHAARPDLLSSHLKTNFRLA